MMGCHEGLHARKTACKVSRLLVLSFISILGWVPVARAENQIVEPGQSIQARLQLLAPGDTLFMKGGTYRETISFPRSGEKGKPIVIRNLPGQVVVVESADRFFELDHDYWVIEGLIFEHLQGATDAIKGSGGRYNTIRSCEIRNGQRDGIDISEGDHNSFEDNAIHDFVWEPGKDAHGIVVDPGVEDLIIRNNVIYNCGGDAIQLYASGSTPIEAYSKRISVLENVLYTTLGQDSENALDFKGVDGATVRNNDVYGFANKAIVVQKGCRNLLFEGNRVHDSDRGIEFRGEDGYWQENVTFMRNVLWNITGEYALKFDWVIGADVLNNTFASAPGNSIRIEGEGIQKGRVHNNLIFDSGKPKVSGTFQGVSSHNGWFRSESGDLGGSGDIIAADPRFADVASAEFHLMSTSPAVDAGLEVGLPFNGTAPDLGASEFTGSPVSVNLVYFRAEMTSERVHLTWKIANVTELYYFEIEKDNGSGTFETIGAVSSGGNGPAPPVYEFWYSVPLERDTAFRLKIRLRSGDITYSEPVLVRAGTPDSFGLLESYPNPFYAQGSSAGNAASSVATISFRLSEAERVRLAIFNLVGRPVRELLDERKPAGSWLVYWDGRDDLGVEVPSGPYFIQLRSGTDVFTKQLSVVRR